MQYSWIIWHMLFVTGSINFANGETTKETATTSADHHSHSNDDYPVNYDDYQNPDYPVPDYYGDGRSLDNDIVPDPNSDENYLKQLESTIPGVPGVDYPMYHTVPDTAFQCDSQRGPGFYGDVETQCQVFHICQEDGRHDSFICPVGTIFNQMNLICDWWFNFKCTDTPTFFGMNGGLEPTSRRMEDVMKKMRRFRETDRRNGMTSSLTNQDQEMEKIHKMMKNRNGIMNLFSPKMRSGNIWKRLRSSEKVVEDAMVRAATVDDRSDFRSIDTTDASGYTTVDDLTTLLTTTDAISPKVSSGGISSPQPTNEYNIDENNIRDFGSSTNIPHTVQSFDTLIMNDTKEDTEEGYGNEVDTTYTIPTVKEDTHSTKESVVLSKINNDVSESSNDLYTQPDVGAESETDMHANFSQDFEINGKGEVSNEKSIRSKLNSLDTTVSTPVSSNNSQLASSTNPTKDRNYSLTLGNDTHISVSVTIRAGISRLKWKRLPEGMSIKKLRIKNAPIASLDDSSNDSSSDLMFRKRMRSKPKTRIMWIPSKNDTLNRKSVWRIFVNSKPRFDRNASKLLSDVMNMNQNAIEPMPEGKVHERIEINPTLSEIDKIQDMEDISNTTLQTENTELAYTLMMPSENGLSNASPSSNLIMDNPIALPLTDGRMENSENIIGHGISIDSEDYQKDNVSETFEDISGDLSNGNFENDQNDNSEETTDEKESNNCKSICVKLLQSIVSHEDETSHPNSYPVSVFRQAANGNEYIIHSKGDVKGQFGRRSYLGASPTEQWGVKYDPETKCNDDVENGKVLIKGWSIIVDAGSVTKEKTVKRRGCDNIFNDSKIIVMKSSTPHRSNVPSRGNTKTNYPQGNKQNNIRFGSTDQQYWLTLVRNWLEAAPDSNMKDHDSGLTKHHSPHTKYEGRYKNNMKESAQQMHLPSQMNNKDHSAASKQLYLRNFKNDWSTNENRRNDWKNNQNTNSPKNNFNQDSISRGNSGSDSREKWTWSQQMDSDVISSQSNRKEWHVTAESKDEIDKRGSLIGSTEVASSKVAAQSWPRTSRDTFLSPKNVADGLSSGKNEEEQYFLREWGGKNVRGKRDWDSQQQNRDRANRPLRNGFSSDETNIPWSSDSMGYSLSRSTTDDYDMPLRSNNNDQWSLNSDTKPDFARDLKKTDWYSEDMTNKGSKVTGNGRDSIITNIKPSWSTKTADENRSPNSKTNTNYRPRTKSSDTDLRTMTKYNRNGRRNPRDWDMGNEQTRPLPNERTWGPSNSKTSSRPKPSDEKKGQSSISDKDKSWPSKDQQKKVEWMPDKKVAEDWSSKDQQEMADWSSDSNVNKAWSSDNQQGKTDWTSDSNKDKAWSAGDQQGKDGWNLDDKKDKAWSAGDQQGKDGWNLDDKKDTAWSAGDQQGKDGWNLDDKKDKAWSAGDQQRKGGWNSDDKKDKAWSAGDQQRKGGWNSDDKKDKAWSSRDQQGKADAWSDSKKDEVGTSVVKQEKSWPSVDDQGRSWSPGDQQLKANWSSENRKPTVWSSRDQQDKKDWSTSNRGDSGGLPSSSTDESKKFPQQNKGRDFPPLRNGKGRIPSGRKGSGRDSFQDMQKDISESSFRGNIDITEDWSAKHAMDKPFWTTDENNDPSRVNKNDDDWFLDNKKDESVWYDASSNGNNKGSNGAPDTHIQTDWNSNKNTPDDYDRSSWNSDSSVTDNIDWSSGRVNVNKPKQPTNSKGSGASPKENFPPSGSVRNPSSETSNWSNNKNIPNPLGLKGQNRQRDWSDENKSTSTYLSNRRDEMNLNWWDADEESDSNSNRPKQDVQSWSSVADDKVRSSNVQPDWSSKPKESKRPTKNMEDWSSNPRDNRMLNTNDEDMSFNKKPDWSSESSLKRMSKSNGDWSSNKNSGWSTESTRTGMPKINRGISSGWGKGSDQNTDRQSTDGPWKTKGTTKTVTPTSRDWNDPPATKIGKPRKDDKEPPTKINNMKGEAGMKEEKIVWSHQISSNGDLGNGWVPITLRPNLKGPENQTRDRNNDKGSPKSSSDWSAVKQQMDRWDSEGLTQNTKSPQFKMDSLTEAVETSTEILDASNHQPFYIPLVNKRFKRANRLVSLTKNYIRPRTAQRIHVTKSSRNIENIKTDENHRFYLASADIIVGDDTTKNENKTSGNTTRKTMKRLFKSDIQYNETIKNSIPSLTRLKQLRNFLEKENLTLAVLNKSEQNLESENSIANNVDVQNNLENRTPFKTIDLKLPQKDQTWDSLMEESETKELWSSPFDSYNVPESGWIPLFRVNKTAINSLRTSILNVQKNETEFDDTAHQVGLPKDLEETETVVVLNANTNSEYSPLPNDTEVPELDQNKFLTHNFTIDIDAVDSELSSEQNMRDGNRTLRIIPFSDIMKQLRQNESKNFETETTTSQEDVYSSKGEWNIPIVATPKMYGLKLVDDSQMQNKSIGSSWTFAKSKPNGLESWVLVKSDDDRNKTENGSDVENQPKNETSSPNSTLYKIIVGNRTREHDLPKDNHKIEDLSSKHSDSYYQDKNKFSFDLKNWHKESGWTPLIRAIGSVTARKVDHGRIQSTR